MKSADGRFEYQDGDGEPLPDGSPLSAVGRFQFQCRSQKNQHCSINIVNAGYDTPKRNWKLKGEVDAPTLSPSINCPGCWHGHIDTGVFMTANKKDREVKQ